MSVDSENSSVLTSCLFQTADEKDESVLEMLSYSKFSDLETWLCTPSSLLLPRALDSAFTSSSSSSTSSSSHASNHSSPCSSSPASNSRRSTVSDPGDDDRLSEIESPVFSSSLAMDTPFLSTPLLSSTPAAAALSSGTSAGDSASQGGVSLRKRRRLAASPGGLHWNSAGHLMSLEVRCSVNSGHLIRLLGRGGVQQQQEEEEEEEQGASTWLKWAGRHRRAAATRAALRKTVSVDDRLLQPAVGEQRRVRLLSRLERGRKKLRNVH
ncbi:uncharacterized protein LOC128436314, partial [Pleuronectes platessa]|uniref:uncharacterized protein LOC128436314 n=1 Tax=Pleuronectes platessa TaxID=8262 RepID=UPI00232A5588